MNNNIELDSSTSSNIYIPSLVDGEYKYTPLPITDGNTPITDLAVPFHLTSSKRLSDRRTSTNPYRTLKYRNTGGFSISTLGLPYEYIRVSNLFDFLENVRIDCSPTLFADNRRGENRFIQTDVIAFDIDNFLPSHPEIFEDGNLHLTIAKFTELFRENDFLITTSLNHQKQKNEFFPRDKYHVFMGLGRTITDEDEVNDLIEKTDYFIKTQLHNYDEIEIGNEEQDFSFIDGAVGSHSQIWGNAETIVYYNKGEPIYGRLYDKAFSDSHREYLQDSRKQKHKNHKENPTTHTNYEVNKERFLKDWDYTNLFSREDVNELFNVAHKNKTGWMCFCDFHEDTNPSLQVFPNGGFNCFPCKSSGKETKGNNFLKYQAMLTGKNENELRKEYITKHPDITHQDYLIWKRQSNTKKDEKVAEEEKDELDEYYIPITETEGDLYGNETLYEALKEMNKRNAILSHGGKISVMGTEITNAGDDRVFQFSSVEDFKKRYKNKRYWVKKINKGGAIKRVMDIGSIWELWEHRRQYDGIDFHPYDDRSSRYEPNEIIWDYWDDWNSATQENVWTGERVKRGLQKFMDLDKLNSLSTSTQMQDAMEDCNLYLQHLQNVILGEYTGNKKKMMLDYLLGWMSKTLTSHGDDRIKIVPVLQGRQGCGKGMMVSRFGELFGKHYLHVQDSRTITHNFNMQLMDTLLVYVNEAIFAGNRQVQNRLKGLITENELQIEAKYLNAFTSRSHLRFIYSSNEDWVVPLEWDNRRYWVLEVSSKYVNNPDAKEYFTNFMSQWKLGGKEALYKFLTSNQIMDMASEINYEYDMPKTSAASNQLLQTDEVIGWIHSLLDRGGHQITDGGNTRVVQWAGKGSQSNVFSPNALFQDFVSFCKTSYGANYITTSIQLSNKLAEYSKKYKFEFYSRRAGVSKQRKFDLDSDTCWMFSDMETFRKAWVKSYWDGDYAGSGLPSFEDEKKSSIDYNFTETKEDSLERGLKAMSDEFSEDILFDDV